MFPNPDQFIDRHVYLFEIGASGKTDAVIIFHACHPVSRSDQSGISPDYVGVLRRAVRLRFGEVPCLFFLGCSGDIRPNLACKRVGWLPRSRLNWRFERVVDKGSERSTDKYYFEAVQNAQLWRTLEIGEGWRISSFELSLKHQSMLRIPRLHSGSQISFEFLPFEISHLFHLEAQKKNPMRFIVSCADRTIGYLPHPRQVAAGGYEVDGSRAFMGLANRVLLNSGSLW